MAVFTGTNGNDTQDGTSGDDAFNYGQLGDDTLNGLEGNDVFNMGGDLKRGDNIDGGDGYDTVVLSGSYGQINDTVFNMRKSYLANIEQINLGSNSYILNFNTAHLRAGQTLTIDGHAVFRSAIDATHVAASFVFTGGPQMDNFYAGSGNDVLSGGTDIDELNGGSGDDILYGGDQLDRLIGGQGHDTYYGGAGNETLSSVDPEPMGETVNGDEGNDTLSGDTDDFLYGGDQNDTLSMSALGPNGGGTMNGGAGDDVLSFGAFSVDTSLIDGGDGTDTLSFEGGAILALRSFSAASTGCEKLTITGGGDLHGDDNPNRFNFATFTAGATTFSFDGEGGRDKVTGVVGAQNTLHGGIGNDNLKGAALADSLFGDDDNDRLSGGQGDDTLDGGKGADTLIGGGGNDILFGGPDRDTLAGAHGDNIFLYTWIFDSTSANYDTILSFNAKADAFDLPNRPGVIDATISTGALSAGSFVDDLSAAVDAAHMVANHAVVFTPDSGDLAGATFLIVDQNGFAGFQQDADFVFRLDGATNLGQLSADNFI